MWGTVAAFMTHCVYDVPWCACHGLQWTCGLASLRAMDAVCLHRRADRVRACAAQVGLTVNTIVGIGRCASRLHGQPSLSCYRYRHSARHIHVGY